MRKPRTGEAAHGKRVEFEIWRVGMNSPLSLRQYHSHELERVVYAWSDERQVRPIGHSSTRCSFQIVPSGDLAEPSYEIPVFLRDGSPR